MHLYMPPKGGLDVADPRSLSDFPRKLAAHYFFALAAYAHYLSLSSESQCYKLEGIQLLVFLFFPFLPIIQLLNNFFKLVSCVVEKRAKQRDVRYLVAGLCGVRTECETDQKDSFNLLDIERKHLRAGVQDYTSLKYRVRLVLLLGNGLVIGLSLAAYVHRLGTTFRSAKYVGALGLDHRMGWMTIGGLTAVVLSLLIHALNTHWRLGPNVLTHSISHEIDDPTSDSIHDDGGELEPQPVAPIFSRAVELSIETAIAALIQDQVQGMTNHPSTYRILRRYFLFRVELVFFWIIMIPWAAMRYRRAFPRLMLPSLGFFGLLLVAGLQLVYDIKEANDISDGEYEPWNYRWAVKDPPWWSL